MGMYNEVYAKCGCGDWGYMQIPQVVLGFGNFYLSDPDTLKELSESELRVLHDEVSRKDFFCTNCESYFNPLKKKGIEKLIRELFSDFISE